MGNLVRSLEYHIPHEHPYKDEVFNVIDNHSPFNAFTRHYLLEEAYDTAMNIHVHRDHDNLVNPYAIVAYHPSEERLSGLLFDRYVRKFVKYRVNEAIPVTLGEFLNMDMESVINILQIASEVNQAKIKEAKQMNEHLEGIAENQQSK